MTTTEEITTAREQGSGEDAETWPVCQMGRLQEQVCTQTTQSNRPPLGAG